MRLTDDEQTAYHQYVHTPSQSYNEVVTLSKKLHGTTGVSSGSKQVDFYMIPTRGPWVRAWLAAQAQGKSTWLRMIAITEARRLVKNKLDDKLYVAHITYEESTDAQEIYYLQDRKWTNEDFWRGKVDPAAVIKAGLKRPELPIYWLGESMARSNIETPPMTIDLCIAGMRAIWKIEKKLPSCIILDYVQEVEVKMIRGQTRTERIISAMRDIVRMGGTTGCAIELGVQARRSSLKNNPPLPEPDDAEWAHHIMQKATNACGIWRPWTTHSDDQSVLRNGVMVNGKSFPLDPNLTVVRSLKHRPGQKGPTIPLILKPDTLEVIDFGDIGNVGTP